MVCISELVGDIFNNSELGLKFTTHFKIKNIICDEYYTKPANRETLVMGYETKKYLFFLYLCRKRIIERPFI